MLVEAKWKHSPLARISTRGLKCGAEGIRKWFDPMSKRWMALINVIGRQNIYSSAASAARESVKCKLMSPLRSSRRQSSDFFLPFYCSSFIFVPALSVNLELFADKIVSNLPHFIARIILKIHNYHRTDNAEFSMSNFNCQIQLSEHLLQRWHSINQVTSPIYLFRFACWVFLLVLVLVLVEPFVTWPARSTIFNGW